MRVSVAWLREWVDAPADPAVLEEALVRVGIEVEEVVDLDATVDGALVVGRVLSIEELAGYKKPIRYCQGVRGIARELSHALGVAYRDPAHAVEAPGATDESPYPVTVEDPVGCDRFAARLVRGIDPAAPTPPVIRNRLAVAGIRSISLAVDITNYLMLELGQPMHAFDPNRLSGPLLVRRARAGERLTTLDGVDRKLDPEDMVICDDTGPISLAAVMGGENSEMQPDSVDVLFEAAHWDPVMVSRTARRHRLLSEAAKRWERGVDPRLALVALEKAVRLLTGYG